MIDGVAALAKDLSRGFPATSNAVRYMSDAVTASG